MASLVKGLRFASANKQLLMKNTTRLLTYSVSSNLRTSARLASSDAASVKSSDNETLSEESGDRSLGATGQNAIILTNRCVQQLKRIASPDTFLRLSVEGGGCSGFQYKFELDASKLEEDILFEQDGASVVIDSESLEYLRGSEVDFTQELIRSAFTVTNNPQSESGCSCGASFNFKV